MRTVLSKTAWRWTLLAALVASVCSASSLPAAAAASPSTSHKRSGHASVAHDSRSNEVGTSTGVAVVGSAVKYVRNADGKVRRVR